MKKVNSYKSQNFENILTDISINKMVALNRQQYIDTLAERLLKSRPILRPFKGRPLTGIYEEIYRILKKQLCCEIDQFICSYDQRNISEKEWGVILRNRAIKKVLNKTHLSQLALAAQQPIFQTELWQYALSELCNALRYSGKLLHLPSSKVSSDDYEEAVNLTLLFICHNIQSYNPSRGDFVAWVNYRLDKMVSKILQEKQDPLTQAIKGKIIRTKYALKVAVRSTTPASVDNWLWLSRGSLDTEYSMELIILWILVISAYFSQLLQTDAHQADAILFYIAKESLYLSSTQVVLNSDPSTLENIPTFDPVPSLADQIREYIQADPHQQFQKHIRNHPKATFQTIALQRFAGTPWKDLSDSFNIGIPALSNFFQRQLKVLAPTIRKAIQD